MTDDEARTIEAFLDWAFKRACGLYDEPTSEVMRLWRDATLKAMGNEPCFRVTRRNDALPSQ